MKALKRYYVRFWGQRMICRPMLLSRVFGDGKEWITVQHMDDRPDYYVVRVPAGTLALIAQQADAWYDLLDEIRDAIDDEAMDFYTERQWREREDKGYVCDTRKWPIPPDSPCGTSWGEYEPSEDLVASSSNNKVSQPGI